MSLAATHAAYVMLAGKERRTMENETRWYLGVGILASSLLSARVFGRFHGGL
jgi:hypothetical protein